LEIIGLRVLPWYIPDFSVPSLTLKVKVVVLLDAPQLLMLFARAPTYLEPKLFLLIVFYNGTFLIIEILIIFKMNVYILCVCVFPLIFLPHMLA
jgi:hypothetical protein